MPNNNKIEGIESNESVLISIDTKALKRELENSEKISVFKKHIESIKTSHEDRVKLQDALSVTLNGSIDEADISNLYEAEKALWDMKELGVDKNIVCDGELCDLVTINDSGEISIDTKDKTKSFKVKDVENFDKNQSYIFDFPGVGNISVHRNPIDDQIIIRRTGEIVLAKGENEKPFENPNTNSSDVNANLDVDKPQAENEEISLDDLNNQKGGLMNEIANIEEENVLEGIKKSTVLSNGTSDSVPDVVSGKDGENSGPEPLPTPKPQVVLGQKGRKKTVSKNSLDDKSEEIKTTKNEINQLEKDTNELSKKIDELLHKDLTESTKSLGENQEYQDMVKKHSSMLKDLEEKKTVLKNLDPTFETTDATDSEESTTSAQDQETEDTSEDTTKNSEAISAKTSEITALKKANEDLKAENEAIGDIDKITTSLNALITEQENRVKNKENLENPIELNSEFKNLDDSQLKTKIDELTEKKTKIKENLGKIGENDIKITELESEIKELEKDEDLTKKVDHISNVLGKDIDEEALKDVLGDNYESIMTFVSGILKLFGFGKEFEANEKALKEALKEANELTLKEIPKIFEENSKEAKEILGENSFKIDISEFDGTDDVESTRNKGATQVLMENLYTLKLPKGREGEFTKETLEQGMKELKTFAKDNNIEGFKELIEGETLNAKTFAAFDSLMPEQIKTLRGGPVTKEELFSSIDIVMNIVKDEVDTSMDAKDENLQSIIDTLKGDTSLDDLLKDESLKSDIETFYTPILQKASKEQFLNGHITELSAFHDDKKGLVEHMEKNHGNAVSQMRKYINASSNKTIKTTKDTFSTIDTDILNELSNKQIGIPTILTKLEKFNNYTTEKIGGETWLIDTGKLDKSAKKELKKEMKTINGSMETNLNKHIKIATYLKEKSISGVKEADLIGLVAKSPKIKDKVEFLNPKNDRAHQIVIKAGKIQNKENNIGEKQERKSNRIDKKEKRKANRAEKNDNNKGVTKTQEAGTTENPPT